MKNNDFWPIYRFIFTRT